MMRYISSVVTRRYSKKSERFFAGVEHKTELLATLRLRGRLGREPCLITLWACFEARIFIIACAEQELKLQ